MDTDEKTQIHTDGETQMNADGWRVVKIENRKKKIEEIRQETKVTVDYLE